MLLFLLQQCECVRGSSTQGVLGGQRVFSHQLQLYYVLVHSGPISHTVSGICCVWPHLLSLFLCVCVHVPELASAMAFSVTTSSGLRFIVWYLAVR